MLSAVGIVRVSQTGGRKGESFHSPTEQGDRIENECRKRGLELVEVYEELDVSGGRALEDRPGLSEAIAAIESKRANVLVAAYLDRLTRSVRVRDEVIVRVEAAGGMVLTVDMGIQTNETASQWLTGTIGSAMNEYQRRASKERSAEAQQRAINRGVPPFAACPPGYKRRVIGRHSSGKRIHGPFQLDERLAPIVREAFEMRAGGETITNIREFLGGHGVKRSYHGVQQMLRSRIYLGQIHFGRYEPNLTAHPKLIDDDLWRRVQQMRGTRGRRPKSDRLLARLGVLRCATCGARMVVGVQTQNGRRYPFYRCPPVGDCPRRVTIGATMVEGAVVEVVKARIAHLRGEASTDEEALQAEVAVEKAQANLDAAIRSFAGLESEELAVEKLTEFRAVRDKAVSDLEHLRGLSSVYTVSIEDWDRFLPEARRALIRAVVDKAEVAPGRGLDRLSISLIE